MRKLVLLRHGESIWNKKNLFTGWTDVGLSEKGIAEAIIAAKELLKNDFVFDIAFTSVLKRAVKTLWIVLENMDLMWIPVQHSWRLNERHYGALQGLNKEQTVQKYGENQVNIWRRSYNTLPPPLEKNDLRWPGSDPRYSHLNPNEIPLTESLKDTSARFLPYWEKVIKPEVKKNSRVIITAHGNSLRALVKQLDNMNDNDISKLNIPTGIPLVYEFDDQMNTVKHYYLGESMIVQMPEVLPLKGQ